MPDARAALRAALERHVAPERLRWNAPLAPLTSFGIGGPADLLLTVSGADELEAALAAARAAGEQVTLLGGGSNVLVSDRGVRGLVLRVRGGSIARAGAGAVRAEAGVTINGLVRWTIQHGLSGLEEWAGTPGSVGGGIYGNAHFQGRLLGEVVVAARLVDAVTGRVRRVERDGLEFGYDASRLQRTREVLLSADFAVAEADPAALRARARASLRYRKGTQPLALPSAGCVFQNPRADEVPDGLPASAGALIDRAGLKGARVGGVRVSEVHANFMVNDGGGRAVDVEALIERCRTAVRERFGVALREEIVRLGERG